MLATYLGFFSQEPDPSLDIGEPCSEEEEENENYVPKQSTPLPYEQQMAAEFEVQLGSPSWKEESREEVLKNIHTAIVSLHCRLDGVEKTLKECMGLSFKTRQPSPKSLSATTSSSSDSLVVNPPSTSSESFAFFCSEVEDPPKPKQGKLSNTSFQEKLAFMVPRDDEEDDKTQIVKHTAHSQEDGANALIIQETCVRLNMSPNLARVLDKEAGSRKNFATKLVRQVFSLQEREVSNVMGLKGKKRLDPTRMELVKSLTFALRPVKPGENEDGIWRKECVKAIDSANRNIKY